MLKNKFYESYTLPQAVSKRLLTSVRKELLSYTLEEGSGRHTYDSKDLSMSVTIQIVSPVLRSTTPRQLVKRMNDAMRCPTQSRNTGIMRGGDKRGKHHSKKFNSQDEFLETFHSLTKVGIGQKKLERNAKMTGLDLPAAPVKNDQQSPLSQRLNTPTEMSRVHLFSKVKRCSPKEKRRNAVAYIRRIALELKATLRNPPAAIHLKPKQGVSLSPTLVPVACQRQQEDSYCHSCYSYTDQSGSASSSSTNSPEMEARQRPQLSIPKIRLISAAGNQSPATTAEEIKGDPIEKALKFFKKKEKSRRFTAQHEGKNEVRATSTFLINMEKLAFEHVLSSHNNAKDDE